MRFAFARLGNGTWGVRCYGSVSEAAELSPGARVRVEKRNGQHSDATLAAFIGNGTSKAFGEFATWSIVETSFAGRRRRYSGNYNPAPSQPVAQPAQPAQPVATEPQKRCRQCRELIAGWHELRQDVRSAKGAVCSECNELRSVDLDFS